MKNITIQETQSVAKFVADEFSDLEGVEFNPHDIEPRSFELERDGIAHDGGSYYINHDGHIILASVGDRVDLGHILHPDAVRRNIKSYVQQSK